MISVDTNKAGQTGHVPTATKPHMYVFGGHCGKGMVMATEMANSGKTACITTVSKRGRPSAPGPSAAFAAAMACESVHYMAACDEKDTKAVECLMDWVPPVMGMTQAQQQQTADFKLADVIEQIKTEMQEMGREQLERALNTIEALKLTVVKDQRLIKARMQHKACSPEEKSVLQEAQLDLQEKEAAFFELIADLSQKISATPPSTEQAGGMWKSLQRLEKELALRKGF